MKASDIVAQEEARQAEFGMEPSGEDFVIAGQQSGIREVVVRIRQNDCGDKSCMVVTMDDWLTMLKEWGIEE